MTIRVLLMGVIVAVCLGISMLAQAQGAIPRSAAVHFEPEWIDYGGLMSPGPGSIFYAPRQDTDTNFCDQVPDTYIYGRVPNGMGAAARDRLKTGCDAPTALWIVADSAHLYYTFNTLGVVELWRRPIDGGNPAELLDTGVEPRALGTDATHVYYAKSEGQTSLDRGIFRLEKANPVSPQQVVPLPEIVGNRINRLLLDNDKVYWTEGFETQNGAVKVVLKAGGPWAGIAQTGIKGAADIKADGNFIYWSELGGRIVRWPKGGGPEQPIHQAELAVVAIDVEDGVLVFTQGNGRDGSIWRMPAAGGGAEPLASEQYAPSQIALVDGWIYWIGGGFKRLNAAADPIELDYVVDWVEVTQAIQNGNNAVPLSAGRATFARVYAHEATGHSGALVRAALYGKTTGGAALPGSPLISAYVDVPEDRPARADADRTFNFTLPDEWVRVGKIDLEVVINPLHNGQQAFETIKTNNQFQVTPDSEFIGRTMCVVSNLVAAETIFGPLELYDETAPEYALIQERAGSILPAQFGVVPTGLVVYKSDGDVYDLREKPDREELKATLGGFAAGADDVFFCGAGFTSVMGIIHENGYMKPGTTGSGFSSPPVFWVQLKDGGSPAYNYPSRGMTMAHEIAHTTANGHVGCDVDPQDNAYPYPVCQIDFNDDETSHWGFDGITDSALNPEDHADFRAYRDPSWVSPYTWKKMGDFPLLRQSWFAPRQADNGPVLWIGGLTAQGGAAGELGPGYVLQPDGMTDRQDDLLAESLAAGADADHALELRGAGGVLLYSRPLVVLPQHLDTEGVEHGDDDRDAFHVVMPYDDRTQSIRLVDKRDGSVLDEIALSAFAPGLAKPQVALSNDQKTLAISWDARDGDGDTLYHTVMINFTVQGDDSTAMTRTLAYATTLSEIEVPAELLPGAAEARVVVLTSDGARTARAVSDPFPLPARKPFGHIIQPAANVTALEGEAVRFAAMAFDPDDGPLVGRSLEWLVDGQSAGFGRWLVLTTLEPGQYEVALRIVDSDGNVVRVTRRVTITARPLPEPPVVEAGALLLPVVVRP